MTRPWFDVDKDGLTKLVERHSKARHIYELISNAWDTSAATVAVELEPIPGRPAALLTVKDDDPDGFRNLAHAWTLFAPSERGADPSKRGRFNLGEKLALAMCREATITTTKGAVRFDASGRHRLRKKTARGSIFSGEIPLTRAEFDEISDGMQHLLPSPGVTLTFNGAQIDPRPSVAEFEVELPTYTDRTGGLRRSRGVALVRLHEPHGTGWIYELGVPVVETGDSWDVDVQQKVPLNMDRDNVTPAFLREVRVAVLNHTYQHLTPEMATSNWVREAAGDNRVSSEAVQAVMDARFGAKRVTRDPSDPEGTKLAMSEGYLIIEGGALSKEEWQQVKRAGAALPAGKVTPSPRPFHPDGEPMVRIPEEEWTPPVREKVSLAKRLAEVLLHHDIHVDVAQDLGPHVGAAYGAARLTLNLSALGTAWFALPNDAEEVLSLLLHEFGHEYSGDHLAAEYHDALCKLGARLVRVAQADPELLTEDQAQAARCLAGKG